MSTITHIASLSDLSLILGKNKDKVTVIDFHASWCGPCHAIAPKYEALSKQYTNVVFTKCDVDAAQPVAKKYGVAAMPSFVFIKDGEQVDLVRGADPAKLESAVKRYASGDAGGTPSSFSGKGNSLGGGSSGAAATPVGPKPVGWLKTVKELDPQVMILGALVAVYLGIFVFMR